MADDLTASVQFSDGSEAEALLQKILEALASNGIVAEVRSLKTIPPDELPVWADPATGRWLVYVDGERMNQAMELIGAICGLTPGMKPND